MGQAHRSLNMSACAQSALKRLRRQCRLQNPVNKPLKINDLRASHEAATLTAMFFQQADIGDGHAAVHGFAHVVDGEQGHLHSGQGFHLHARGARALRGGVAQDA